jgi:hypothetical protein
MPTNAQQILACEPPTSAARGGMFLAPRLSNFHGQPGRERAPPLWPSTGQCTYHLELPIWSVARVTRSNILPNLSKLMLRFLLNCQAAQFLVWANLPLLLLAQEWRSPEKKAPRRPPTPGHTDAVSKSGSKPQTLPSTLPLVVR